MAVAVAVERTQYLVLDSEYRIVEVGPSARATFGPLLGEGIYEAFPDCEPLFRPYYDRARETRGPVEFATFYDGYVMHLRAERDGDDLVVSWDTLAHLDVLTLDGLIASLETALSALASLEEETDRSRRRAALRVVGGSG